MFATNSLLGPVQPVCLKEKIDKNNGIILATENIPLYNLKIISALM